MSGLFFCSGPRFLANYFRDEVPCSDLTHRASHESVSAVLQVFLQRANNRIAQADTSICIRSVQLLTVGIGFAVNVLLATIESVVRSVLNGILGFPSFLEQAKSGSVGKAGYRYLMGYAESLALNVMTVPQSAVSLVSLFKNWGTDKKTDYSQQYLDYLVPNTQQTPAEGP